VKRWGSPETVQAGLSVAALAPFVDLMTLLLVYLLRTWASEPTPHPPEPVFAVAPTRAAASRRAGAIEVIVGREAIYVDGQRVVALRYLPGIDPSAPPGPPTRVEELYAPLLAMRGRTRVEVHADATAPWSTLRAVLHTARAAGFTDVALVGEAAGP
jgi:hypothetical protein